LFIDAGSRDGAEEEEQEEEEEDGVEVIKSERP
jgi:hypothetical protein